MKNPAYIKNVLTYGSLVVCLIANNVFADCDSTGTHYPSVVPPNYQGSGQTDSFNCAVKGSKQLSIDEIRDRADLIPPKLDNRFYVMLGFNAAAEGVIMVKNKTTVTSTYSPGTVSSTSNKVASNNFEMAFGYTWKEFAIDLEWLALKSMDYSTNVTDTLGAYTFNSTIKGDALLFNLYWFFNDMYNVKVYGVFSANYAQTKSISYISGGSVTTTNRYYPGLGFGIGARFNIFSRLYADFAGRLIALGKINMQAVNGTTTIKLQGQRTWLGASARLLWLI